MAVIKQPYELSVWSEALKGEGQKEESRKFIIGAHDMTYLGRASAIKLKTKLNGTHELTFQIPTKYFDSELGKYVENKFIDEVFAERKVKLFYKEEWLEFSIKQVKEDKKLKGLIKNVTCQDAFIDELSRNGYGITFDEELYNNVEEIGTFTEEILEDSIWYYEPKNNWGDFTEYLEEKLYKIPISQFSNLKCYKLDFTTNSSTKITNAFTGENRPLEMGDDQARVEKIFWDQKGGGNPIASTLVTSPENDGYIYIPYSCLDFCYCSKSEDRKYDIAATEEPYAFDDKTLALAPSSVDPNYLIQFYAVPAGEKLEIDEAGLLLDKSYIYFMTLDQWNKNVHNNNNSSDYWYIFKEKEIVTIDDVNTSRIIKKVIQNPTTRQKSMGNKIVRYEGYLTEWDQTNIVKGKKIQISDRSEINISDEIDQYVTVYNNNASDYDGMYTSEDWSFEPVRDKDYRVCSKIATRQIIPQLARNFAQNGTDIKSTSGWEVMGLYDSDNQLCSGKIKNGYLYSTQKNALKMPTAETGFIYFASPRYDAGIIWQYYNSSGNPYGTKYYQKLDNIYTLNTETATNIEFRFYKTVSDFRQTKNGENRPKATQQHYYIYPKENISTHIVYGSTTSSEVITFNVNSASYNALNSVINFGPVGQEKTLEKDKIYCLGLSITKEKNKNGYIKIGEGSLTSNSEYTLNENKTITIPLSSFCSVDADIKKIESDEQCYTTEITRTTKYIFIKPAINIEKPYIVITALDSFAIFDLELFEVYTKGKDQFGSSANYQYSGRDYLLKNSNLSPIRKGSTIVAYQSTPKNKGDLINEILFEDDIMMGDTYEYQQYFIQRLKTKDNTTYDTMGKKEFITSNPEKFITNELPLDEAEYSEDDYEIETNYIDLNNCSYYNAPAGVECSHSKSNGICMYQMYGYCPYRFTTEKHCRKIRTLKGEKSNRFNLTQELSKVFECYPIYKIEHNENGYVEECVRNGKTIMDKRIFFIKEKGNDNLFGFRYKKNLSDISRTIKSDKIVTKLYVQDVDSDISRTGLCSIKTAEDNPSKDSFIIDLSYYTTKGMLDEATVEQDLYGTKSEENGLNGYLKALGFYNGEYDRLSNQIINLEDSSFTELEANLNVNLDGIETAQKQMKKYAEQIDKYKLVTTSQTSMLDSYKVKYAEQEQILNQLVVDTFQTNGVYDTSTATISATPPSNWISKYDIKTIREKWLGNHQYKNGILGQYNKEYLQIQAWKKERASYLKQINKISAMFFKKYEPFLKEGTWSDSNYISDNAYYHGALEVAAEGAIPNVEYSFKVVDISALPEYRDYEFKIADTSFIEDEELFGFDVKSGLPNRIKVLISEISEELDSPSKNSITVQNFTTQFEDLFKQVTATVQSLSFNENIYKRSSNFTSLQNVSESSLQGTLDSNSLTLLSTSENNIQLDSTGQKGSDINNHANQYALDGQGLQFSNNGGESWNVGVGPNGINADYINVGMLDAGKIRIADSGYVYFSWDKEGIAAYRDPQSATSDNSNINDYALFNRYGLSLIRDGTIRLRSGYNFNGDATGDISSEKDVGGEIGFYLYNKDGNIIFRNYTSNDIMSARIEMQGELFLTDGSLEEGESYETIYTYSNILKDSVNYAKVYVKGTLNTSPGEVISKSKEKVFVKEGSDYTYGNLYKCTFRILGTLGDITQTYLMTESVYNSIALGDNLSSKTKYAIFSSNEIIFYTNSSASDSSRKINISTDVSATTIYYLTSSTTLSALTVYKIGTSYYKNKSSSRDYRNSGAIGLFLNNKEAINSTTEKATRRILSCVTTSSNTSSNAFNNIFTITKDGSLYIGGIINDSSANSLNELSDNVIVNNAPISMNTYGQLILDFENLKNSDNTSLIQYVTDAIKTISLAGEWGRNRLGDWDAHQNSVEWAADDSQVRSTLNNLITCVADMRRALNDIYLLTKDGIQT